MNEKTNLGSSFFKKKIKKIKKTRITTDLVWYLFTMNYI